MVELSLAEKLAKIPEGERKKFIEGLSEDEAKELRYTWEFWARPNQLAPVGNWVIWLLLSGRGFGKSRAGAEWVNQKAKLGVSPIALIGQTKADVHDTMVEVGESSILKISPPWFYPKYEITKRRLVWPNGVIGIIYSADEPDQLRGPQHGAFWWDEPAKAQYPQQTYDNLMMGLRVGDNPQGVMTTTPRPIKFLKDIIKDSRTVITRGHTLENKSNLPPKYLEYIISKYQGTRLGRQELAGELLDSTEGLVYDSFRFDTQVIPRKEIPKHWTVYTGHDFGTNNTAAVWFAVDPDSGFMYLYRTYHQPGGTKEHAANFKELSNGENVIRRTGGSHQEQPIRDGYVGYGWSINEPSIRGIEAQVDRTWNIFKSNKVYVFSDLSEFLEEMSTYSWETDEEDKLTQKIHNGTQYHLMDATRYALSELMPENESKMVLHTVRRF